MPFRRAHRAGSVDPRRPRRRALVLAVVLGCLGVAVAGAGTATAAPAAKRDAFRPVTIQHRYGSTKVSALPKRIVSLDPQWTDVLLAMGITPAGYIRSAFQDEDFPWQGDELEDSTTLPYTNALPYEQIAALKPDLILATYAVPDDSTYKSLSAIAPTIPSITEHEVESWQDLTTTTGKIMGRSAKAKKVIAGVDAKVRSVGEKLPGLRGKTIAFANFLPGTGFVVLGDPEDGANALFTQLGLKIAPSIRKEAKDATGRVQVSLERTDLLDGDILAILTNGANVDQIPGWSTLPAVRTGAVTIMDMSSATALNTPSPLSIPYGLEVMQPALAKAAAA